MNKYIMWAALILAGVVLADKIRSLPLGNKIPSL